MINFIVYAVPASKLVPVKHMMLVVDLLSAHSAVEFVIATESPLTKAELMVTVLPPELVTMISIVSGVPGENATLVIDTCSALPINPMVVPPIHAATTTLTATVTAMSIIDATTGLRAFEFFLTFLTIFKILNSFF